MSKYRIYLSFSIGLILAILDYFTVVDSVLWALDGSHMNSMRVQCRNVGFNVLYVGKPAAFAVKGDGDVQTRSFSWTLLLFKDNTNCPQRWSVRSRRPVVFLSNYFNREF